MQIRFTPFLLAAALLLPAAAARAASETKVTVADERPTKLSIVFIDRLHQSQWRIITDFDRLDLAFQHIAKQRKWPIGVEAERLTANTVDHPIELRIFYPGLREDIGGEFLFRAWMTLVVKGVKHDLGMISHRYTVRPWENSDDVFEKVFRGAAYAAADKIEPLIFTRVPGRPASISDAAAGKR